MEAKRELTIELASVVKTALKEERGDGNEGLSSNVVMAVCNVTEAIFIHGLKDPYFIKGSRHAKYPEPNFWPFISKFASRNVRYQISNLSQIKTEVGKARAWLRLALNESVMENYIASFIREVYTVRLFYHRYSYLRDSEQIEIMMNYMKALSRLNFNIPVNSSILNSWTPTPLRLAGLLKQSRQIAHLSVPEMDEMEDDVPLAVSALDFEGLGDSPTDNQSPMSTGGLSSPTATRSEASYNIRTAKGGVLSDDECSVFSHPSLVDARFAELMRTMEKEKKACGSSQGTPNPTVDLEDSGYDDPDPAQRKDVVVHRTAPAGTSSPKRSNAASPVVSDSERPKKQTVETGIQTETLEITEEQVPAEPEPSPMPSLAEEIATAEETKLKREDESFVSALDVPLLDSDEKDFESSQETAESPEKSISDKKSIEIEPSPIKYRNFEQKSHSFEPRAEFSPSSDRCLSPVGNSLLGKGWSSADLSVDTSRSSSFFADEQSSETESMLAGANFSSVMRSALICRQAAEEEGQSTNQRTARVVESAEGGDFAAAMNEEVEIGRSTLADEEEDENGRLSREVATKRSKSPDDFVMLENSLPSAPKEENPSQMRFGFVGRVAQETGLASQGYLCHTCRRYIGLAYGPFRVCAFDGCYYCVDCHRNDEAVVPGKLVLSWDLTPKKVSRASKAFLDHIADRPLIHLDQTNPTLYDAVEAMCDTLRLREQLSYVAMYLLSCKESVAEDLRKRLWPKEYLYSDVHLYSINDLINVSTGVLPKHLKAVIGYAKTHVVECRLCIQKGFICEICNHPQIIYPFQIETTHRCEKCYAVFHLGCSKGRPCPKCHRRESYIKERKSSKISEEEMMNHLAMEDT